MPKLLDNDWGGGQRSLWFYARGVHTTSRFGCQDCCPDTDAISYVVFLGVGGEEAEDGKDC